MDNQHKLIKGYRDLSQEEIDLMNEGKELGLKLQAYIDKITALPTSPDMRALAIGKTDLQTGLMWTIRAVAKPQGF